MRSTEWYALYGVTLQLCVYRWLVVLLGRQRPMRRTRRRGGVCQHSIRNESAHVHGRRDAIRVSRACRRPASGKYRIQRYVIRGEAKKNSAELWAIVQTLLQPANNCMYTTYTHYIMYSICPRGHCYQLPRKAIVYQTERISVVTLGGHSQSGQAMKLFQAPRKISFTFYF